MLAQENLSRCSGSIVRQHLGSYCIRSQEGTYKKQAGMSDHQGTTCSISNTLEGPKRPLPSIAHVQSSAHMQQRHNRT